MENGTQLGRYCIEAPIGAGGMGEVYRAHDSALDRDVAVKVLPSEFSRDEVLLARLKKEARSLAAVNHPGVATIHGIEEIDGTRFLVLELVEGQTLADRLSRGPIPVREAVEIAGQLAGALEAAHEQGIVHRDLKPANIMIGPRGRVKVLDFGLAKPFQLGNGTDLSEDATAAVVGEGTVPTGETQPGGIVGTWPYMSPEQVRGQDVGRRTDVWAFGCVLYEMLTGRRAFGGKSVADTLAAVLDKEPDWAAIPEATPFMVRSLLHRSLRKDVDRRLRDLRDVQLEIEDVLGVSGETVIEPAAIRIATEATPSWKKALPWGLVAVMALITAVAVWGSTRPSEFSETFVRHFQVEIGDVPLSTFRGAGAVLSPDSSRVAYVGKRDERRYGLYVETFDQRPAVRLVEDDVMYPFFSPDGEWVGYSVAGELWKVEAGGGVPSRMPHEVEARYQATWASDGSVVYGSREGLFRIPAGGGSPVQLTRLEDGESWHVSPAMLPEGRGILFMAAGEDLSLEAATLEVLDLETGERRELYQGGGHGRYLSSGHLVFADSETLYAAPFDLHALEMTGPPVPVLEGLGSYTGRVDLGRCPSFSIADNGDLLYLGTSDWGSTLLRHDRYGVGTALWDTEAHAVQPLISPEGTRVAVSKGDPGQTSRDVWVHDLERGVQTQITFSPGFRLALGWMPNGRDLAVVSADSLHVVQRYRADGTGEAEPLFATEPGDMIGSITFTPDGSTAALQLGREGPGWGIWTYDLSSGQLAGPVHTGVHPRLSPDGRWLAYTDLEASWEIFVEPFPRGEGRRVKVSSSGGGQPRWSGDGRQVFYRTDRGVMVADIDVVGGQLRAGRPRILFEGDFTGGYMGIGSGGWWFPDFAASPEGESFFILSETNPAIHRHTLVQNWLDELKEQVPSGR